MMQTMLAPTAKIIVELSLIESSNFVKQPTKVLLYVRGFSMQSSTLIMIKMNNYVFFDSVIRKQNHKFDLIKRYFLNEKSKILVFKCDNYVKVLILKCKNYVILTYLFKVLIL